MTDHLDGEDATLSVDVADHALRGPLVLLELAGEVVTLTPDQAAQLGGAIMLAGIECARRIDHLRRTN